MDTLGSRIKKVRTKRGLNQEQFAQMIGSYQKQVSAYENDKHQPSIEVLRAMGEIFGASADWLLGLSDNPQLPHIDETQPESQRYGLRAASLITQMDEKDSLIALEILSLFTNIKPDYKPAVLEILRGFNTEFGLSKEEKNNPD